MNVLLPRKAYEIEVRAQAGRQGLVLGTFFGIAMGTAMAVSEGDVGWAAWAFFSALGGVPVGLTCPRIIGRQILAMVDNLAGSEPPQECAAAVCRVACWQLEGAKLTPGVLYIGPERALFDRFNTLGTKRKEVRDLGALAELTYEAVSTDDTILGKLRGGRPALQITSSVGTNRFQLPNAAIIANAMRQMPERA